MKKTTTIGDIFDDYEKERLAQIEKDQAEFDKPENVAKRAAKEKSEHERGVRLGWWNDAGDALNFPDEETDEDEEDEDGL